VVTELLETKCRDEDEMMAGSWPCHYVENSGCLSRTATLKEVWGVCVSNIPQQLSMQNTWNIMMWICKVYQSHILGLCTKFCFTCHISTSLHALMGVRTFEPRGVNDQRSGYYAPMRLWHHPIVSKSVVKFSTSDELITCWSK
jgi:hypothetical protein